MIRFDPSPWLLLTIPFLGVVIYVCYRGFARNEFRERGKWGWVIYRTGSFDWWLTTLGNLMFLGAGLFLLFQSAFHGSEFSREPELPMPAMTGSPIQSVIVPRSPDSLARCLAALDHGTLYAPSKDGRRVAVRNGRNQIMYIFDIVPAGGDSRMDVYQSLRSPFVNWDKCLTGPR